MAAGPATSEIDDPTAAAAPSASPDLFGRLLEHGVDRRSFLKYCGVLTATLALPPAFTPKVAHALGTAARPTMVYLAFQDCTGNAESMLRARNPDIATLILDLLSVDYQETIMAAAGQQSRDARDAAVAKGGHIVVVEGSIPTGGDGYCTIGGESAEQIMRNAAKGAVAIINVGTCSAFGGLPAAHPNPTGAVAVGDVVSGVPIVNLPGCPMNADNLTATIAHYLTFTALPARDNQNRPLFAYGDRIHDNCPRRGHFDAGQFAMAWGDEGHRKGHCLYKLGCKGPSTFHNCPIQKWNGRTNWPIGAGHGCVGCSEAGFWDTMTPFYDRLPHITGFGVDATAEQIGLAVVGATAVGFGLHGAGKILQHTLGQRASTRSPSITNPETGQS
jgi:hydrogenase small subunit